MTFEVWHMEIHLTFFEVWNGSLLGYEGIAILPYCQAELGLDFLDSGERETFWGFFNIGIPSKQLTLL